MPLQNETLERKPTRRGWWLLALLTLLLALYYGSAAPDRVAGTSDSALYVGLARNLVAGNGYSFNFEPHTMAPPGYPLMLAAVMRLFGEGYPLLNWVSTLAAAAAFVATYLLASEHAGDRRLAVAVAALTASTCAFFVYASKILSDMAYVPLLLLALWCGLRWIRDERVVSPSGIACALLTVAVYLTRHIGIAAIIAIVLGLLVSPRRSARGRRAWLKVAFYLLILFPPLACWHSRNYTVSDTGSGYAVQVGRGIRRVDVVDANRGTLSPGGIAVRLTLVRPRNLLRTLGRNMLFRRDPRFGMMWLGIGLFCLASMIVGLRKGYNVLAGYCLISAGIHALMSRSLDRYILPFIPFGFLFLLIGVAGVAQWIRRRHLERGFCRLALLAILAAGVAVCAHVYERPVVLGLSRKGLAALIACAALAGIFAWLQSGGQRRRALLLTHAAIILAAALITWNVALVTALRLGPLRRLPRAEDRYFAAADWLRLHSDADDAFAATRRVFHLLTGRRIVKVGRIADPERNWQRLRKNSVRFIVNDTAEKDERLYFMPMIRAHEKELSLRGRFDTINIYETPFPRPPAYPQSRSLD